MSYQLHVAVELEDAEWLEMQVRALRFLSRTAAVRWCVNRVRERRLLARWEELQRPEEPTEAEKSEGPVSPQGAGP